MEHTKDNVKKKIRLNTVFNIISATFVVVLVLLATYGIKIGLFRDTDVIEQEISKAGVYGPLAFIFIQVIQVVVPIIPGGVVLAAGGVLFGTIEDFIYNYIGIIVGSSIHFLLIRRYGSPLVKKFSSEKTYNKYKNWLETDNHFYKLFVIAILLPGAPDDLLCMFAGLTEMTFKKFLVTILIAKPLSIVLYSVLVNVISELLGKL